MSVFIVDLLESFLGTSRKHNDSKGQIAFDCPACAVDKGKPQGDGKGNLEVNYNKGVFRCWSCMHTNNMHGFIPKLIKRWGNNEILKEYLVLRPRDRQIIEKTLIEVKFPKGYKKLSETPHTDFKFHDAMRYLAKRRIHLDLIKEFDIGYTTVGEFKDRIIIPSYDQFGDINYFIARAFSSGTKPKYLNPEADKQEIIFNENKINFDATIYLVEGVFDHIVIPNSIPLLGKYISDKLFDALYEKASANIVIILDSDAYEDAEYLYKRLDIGKLSGKIKICIPKEGLDPALIYQMFGKRGILELLKGSERIPESRL